jgi:hypothetical protein
MNSADLRNFKTLYPAVQRTDNILDVLNPNEVLKF